MLENDVNDLGPADEPPGRCSCGLVWPYNLQIPGAQVGAAAQPAVCAKRRGDRWGSHHRQNLAPWGANTTQAGTQEGHDRRPVRQGTVSKCFSSSSKLMMSLKAPSLLKKNERCVEGFQPTLAQPHLPLNPRLFLWKIYIKKEMKWKDIKGTSTYFHIALTFNQETIFMYVSTDLNACWQWLRYTTPKTCFVTRNKTNKKLPILCFSAKEP